MPSVCFLNLLANTTRKYLSMWHMYMHMYMYLCLCVVPNSQIACALRIGGIYVFKFCFYSVDYKPLPGDKLLKVSYDTAQCLLALFA